MLLLLLMLFLVNYCFKIIGIGSRFPHTSPQFCSGTRNGCSCKTDDLERWLQSPLQWHGGGLHGQQSNTQVSSRFKISIVKVEIGDCTLLIACELILYLGSNGVDLRQIGFGHLGLWLVQNNYNHIKMDIMDAPKITSMSNHGNYYYNVMTF